MVEFTADDNSEGIFDDFCIFSYGSELPPDVDKLLQYIRYFVLKCWEVVQQITLPAASSQGKK